MRKSTTRTRKPSGGKEVPSVAAVVSSWNMKTSAMIFMLKLGSSPCEKRKHQHLWLHPPIRSKLVVGLERNGLHGRYILFAQSSPSDFACPQLWQVRGRGWVETYIDFRMLPFSHEPVPNFRPKNWSEKLVSNFRIAKVRHAILWIPRKMFGILASCMLFSENSSRHTFGRTT